MGWMVLTVANMVQEKKTDGLGHDIRWESEGTKRGHKDDKEFAVDCLPPSSNLILASIHAGER